MTIINDPKYKDAFLREAKGHLNTMNKCLLEFEKNPTRIGLVKNILRASHTLKSMSSMMNYNKMAVLSHTIEDVLHAIKKKKIKIKGCVDILFECFDILEVNLKAITQDKEEVDTDKLVKRMKALITQTPITQTQIPQNSFRLRRKADADNFAVSALAKITSIEVKIEKLDLLMNLAEELMINRMHFERLKTILDNPELSSAVDTLGRVVSDMQYNIMQARMVPIGFIFNRFPRMVRDLAKLEKKEVDIQIEGADIELDRAIVEDIAEPLIHLLRNAIDHGIESAEERRRGGKLPVGVIKLSASRAKGFVIIEVEDDGAGLDWKEIKNRAIQQGILSEDASEEKILDSLFFGLSTSKHVTSVSGRGLGLNIVKKKIESMGGFIKVESHIKRGTRFIIEIPLTLAVIKTLFVEIGKRTYAIPIASVERLVYIPQQEIKGMMNYEAIVLNGEDIPITRLFHPVQTQSPGHQIQPIVIIKRGEERMGLAVDGFLDTRETVLKPFNRLVRENKNFAGCSIVGSGEVVLVLDVNNLILSKRTMMATTGGSA